MEVNNELTKIDIKNRTVIILMAYSTLIILITINFIR